MSVAVYSEFSLISCNASSAQRLAQAKAFSELYFALLLSISIVESVFTIDSSKIFEISHQVSNNRNIDGLGVAAGFDSEIYTQVYILKL